MASKADLDPGSAVPFQQAQLLLPHDMRELLRAPRQIVFAANGPDGGGERFRPISPQNNPTQETYPQLTPAPDEGAGRCPPKCVTQYRAS